MFSHCPISGVCIKRFWLSIVSGFAFAFAFDWIVNAYFMRDLYDRTPQLWRSDAEMQETVWVIWLYEFVVVLLTAFIFTRNYEGRGTGEGVRFGALIGLLFGVQMAASYAWMPISADLAVAWLVTGVLKGLGLGVIYALTYCDGKKDMVTKI
ncbi:MAG: hypothetical protein ACT4OY_09280 [Alphaproteobacteria bacterium]